MNFSSELTAYPALDAGSLNQGATNVPKFCIISIISTNERFEAVRIQRQIEEKLTEKLSPVYLDVANESHQHRTAPDAETHFKVTVVSSEFEGKSLIERHRQVNEILADELSGPVHALALHTYTESDWQKRAKKAPDSPACRGGGKR